MTAASDQPLLFLSSEARKSMIRKKPAPHLMRGGSRFSEKIMLKQKDRARWRFEEKSSRS